MVWPEIVNKIPRYIKQKASFRNTLAYSQLSISLFPLNPKAPFSPRNDLFGTEKRSVSRCRTGRRIKCRIYIKENVSLFYFWSFSCRNLYVEIYAIIQITVLFGVTDRYIDHSWKFNLLHEGKLNNAAAVMFGHDFYYYPQCLLHLTRFIGTTKDEFIDNQRVNGNIYSLLDVAMAFFFKHLSLSGKIEVLLRLLFTPFYQQIQGNTCQFSKKEGKCWQLTI